MTRPKGARQHGQHAGVSNVEGTGEEIARVDGLRGQVGRRGQDRARPRVRHQVGDEDSLGE